jgi:outer membrane receptor protein involved in Fe transport
MKACSLAVALTLLLGLSSAAWAGPLMAAQQPPPQPPAPAPTQPPPDPEEEEEEPPIYAEQVVVTASRVEQQLVNAPATVSVVTSRRDREFAGDQLRGAAAFGPGHEHHADLGA